MDLSFAAVAAIVFFAFFTQAAIGFGAMVIALTLSALLYPLDILLSWFVPLVILLSAYLLIRHHGHIDWQLFFKRILPGMGLGFIAGQWLFYSLDTEHMKTALGALVIFLAGRELLRRKAPSKHTPLLPWTLAAGVVHGAFASGGPLLVHGLNTQNLNKATFRSTLTVVWMVMALVLATSYLISGKLNSSQLPQIGMLAAVLPISILAGEWLHQRIDAQRFKTAINVLLLICGLILLLR